MNGDPLPLRIRVAAGLTGAWVDELVGWAGRHPRLACTVDREPGETPSSSTGGPRDASLYERLDRAVFGRRPPGPDSRAEGPPEPAPSGQRAEVTMALGVRAADAPGSEHWFVSVAGFPDPARALSEEHRRGDLTFRVAIETVPTVAGGATREVEAAVCSMDPISLHRNRAAAADRVRELIETAISRRLAGVEAPPMPDAAERAPGEGRTPRLLRRLTATGANRVLRRDQWSVLWRRCDPAATAWALEPGPWNRITPPDDRAYADPFLHARDGAVFVFMEEFPFATGRGVISASRLAADGTSSPPVTVLESEHHLSYPFVFDHGGETYMVPECAASGRIVLYRCADYPTRWEPIATLVEGIPLVDPTLAEVDGRWWMWAGLLNRRGTAADRLALFYASELTGPWVAHPQTPVVSDIRSARPAGAILHHGGDLIRPVQGGAGRYGRRLGFQQVSQLSEHQYGEVPVGQIDAGRFGAQGVHTYVRAAGIEAIDVVRERSKLLLLGN